VQSAIMSLGDHLAHPITGEHLTEQQRHRQLVESAVWADEAGFDAVHLGEHHFNDYILSSPPIVLAAIAERTSNLILSTAVTLAANLDPVRVAEDYATLDLLSDGRVEIVTGRGSFFSNTFPGFGQDAKDARAIYTERVELLRGRQLERRTSHPPRQHHCAAPTDPARSTDLDWRRFARLGTARSPTRLPLDVAERVRTPGDVHTHRRRLPRGMGSRRARQRRHHDRLLLSCLCWGWTR
jgi:alkanesulfonate monooxygenase SsuD/methylene tetrahydromethanopterin reductase-like flavin-dependent oxidoreductase (luciferase family)